MKRKKEHTRKSYKLSGHNATCNAHAHANSIFYKRMGGLPSAARVSNAAAGGTEGAEDSAFMTV
jgi:hypothetical protein